MATQTQKANAAKRLITNPETKLTVDELKNIKLNLSLKEGIVNLLIESNPVVMLTQYLDDDGQVTYFCLGVDTSNTPNKQLTKFLTKAGFVERFKNIFIVHNYTHTLFNYLDVMKLIQYFNEIKVFKMTIKASINSFLASIENNASFETIFDHYLKEELIIIDDRLRLHGLLKRGCYQPVFEEVRIKAILNDHGYVLSGDDISQRLVTENPLSVVDIIKMDSTNGSVKYAIMIAYFNGQITNIIEYEDVRKPTDPLILFNEVIDELQSKHTSIEELAKELILLGAKHLK